MFKTLKIDVGLFLNIPGWETDQSLLGNAAAHVRNIFGQADDVTIHNGAVLVNNDRPADRRRWGFTLGPYINSQNIEIDSDIYDHEYGHTIQSKILGPLYLSKVAIPSLYSNRFNSATYHESTWYEVWASQLGGAANHSRDFRHRDFWYWFKIAAYPFYPK